MNNVSFGIGNFCAHADQLKKSRIGLVTNDAATNEAGIKSRIALIKAGFQIVKLFSPEHGLSSRAADGLLVADQVDEVTNLPVVSLYADKLQPSAEDLEDVDMVVFDIPDVGCRFYTYLWTMTYVMEACAKHHKSFVLLDRPNPLSGDLSKSEGPLLDPACASFLGRWNIPVRHSCTLGELANYFSSHYISGLDLRIIKMQNWNRRDFPGKVTWNFIPTSPAIKDAETALLYPGLGLLEGINVNEGRGTADDFKIMGAPWINRHALKKHFDQLNIPGIAFSETQYVPEWGMFKGEICSGLIFHFTEKRSFRPVKLGMEVLKQLIQQYPSDCKERLYKTNVHPTGEKHLDKLLGIPNSFFRVKNNITTPGESDAEQWQDMIKPYLLY